MWPIPHLICLISYEISFYFFYNWVVSTFLVRVSFFLLYLHLIRQMLVKREANGIAIIIKFRQKLFGYYKGGNYFGKQQTS